MFFSDNGNDRKSRTMPTRLSDATKRLHGTARRRPAPPSIGTPRIARPIPPPKGLPKELREHWKRHMLVMVASGRMATVDLLAFNELIRAARMVDLAYDAAIEEGPTVPADKGQTKTGSAFRAYMIAAGNYRGWLSRFGLDPKSRGMVRQLPALAGNLHLVEDADDE
jgi:P27 family predicted phage terminase small subunit